MASDGIRSTRSNGRRKLIQPVVPALPLPPKSKKDIVDSKAGSSTTNDVDFKDASQLRDESNIDAALPNSNGNGAIASRTTDVIDPVGGEDRATTDIIEPLPTVAAAQAETSKSLVAGEKYSSELPQSNGLHIAVPSEASNTESSFAVASSNSNGTSLSIHEDQNANDVSTKIEGAAPLVHYGDDSKILHTPVKSATATGTVSPMTTELSTAEPSDKMAVGVFSHPSSNGSLGDLHRTQPPICPEHNSGTNGNTQTYPEVYNNNAAPVHRVPQYAYVPPPAPQVQIPPIMDYLLHLAHSKQFADWTIQVEQPKPGLQSFYAYAHSMVLLRSDRLRKSMARLPNPAMSAPLLRINPGRNIQAHAFEAALRFLYSDTVLSAEALFPRNTYMDSHARSHIADYILSYLVAGIELGLEPVSTRAISLIAETLHWDVVEMLVKEACALRMLSSPVKIYDQASESIAAAEIVIQMVFDFILVHLNAASFRLEVNTPSSIMPSRFAYHEADKSAANPALAGMVFGSMPSSADMSPASPSNGSVTSPDIVVSNILLNLGYHDLGQFAQGLSRVHPGDAGRIMTEVVEEREKRRLSILNDRTIPNKQRLADTQVWDVIGVREYVDQGKLRQEQVEYTLTSGKRYRGRGQSLGYN